MLSVLEALEIPDKIIKASLENNIIHVFNTIDISINPDVITSVIIRQKSESQNGCIKKRKHAKFSEKQIFLTP